MKPKITLALLCVALLLATALIASLTHRVGDVPGPVSAKVVTIDSESYVMLTFGYGDSGNGLSVTRVRSRGNQLLVDQVTALWTLGPFATNNSPILMPLKTLPPGDWQVCFRQEGKYKPSLSFRVP